MSDTNMPHPPSWNIGNRLAMMSADEDTKARRGLEMERDFINRLYGPNTFTIETAFDDFDGEAMVRVRIRPTQLGGSPPAGDDRPLTLTVDLPTTLSATGHRQPPQFPSLRHLRGVPLHMRNAVLIVVQAVWPLRPPPAPPRPGYPSFLADALVAAAKHIRYLSPAGIVAVDRDVPFGVRRELHWTTWPVEDGEYVGSDARCAVCRDRFLVFRLVKLPCGCRYCGDCFGSEHGVDLFMAHTDLFSPVRCMMLT